jgi:protein TonB
MRLALSFVAALLVALALFALMLVLVMPPRDDADPVEELARVSFVRSVSDTQSDSRERQQREAPDRPQPPDQPPVQPTPPQPQVSAAMDLNISVPNVPTQIQVSSAPSLTGLTAAQVEAAPQPAAPPPDSSPSVSEEVTPLTDVPPNYPQRALASGIEGEAGWKTCACLTPNHPGCLIVKPGGQPAAGALRHVGRMARRWRVRPPKHSISVWMEVADACSRHATHATHALGRSSTGAIDRSGCFCGAE